jgi:hypothetical protein
MKRKWIFFVAPPAIVVFVALFGEIVKWLWNWLLPSLFGLHAITFWQALGLLALCRILFGGWGGPGPDRSKSRRRPGPEWDRLTPEEREHFLHSMRGRCGFDPPATGADEPA